MKKISLIIDTDLCSDCDDVGAIQLACAYTLQHQADILGVVVNTTDPYVPGCIDAIRVYMGLPSFPIGTTRTPCGPGSAYTRHVYENFPHEAGLSASCPDAVTVYRRLLAAREQRDVVIVSIGFLTNLADLCNSSGDTISPLTGQELIAASVQSLLVMGGSYPSSPKDGYQPFSPRGEFNFAGNPKATREVVSCWPTPIVFVGFEAGATCITPVGGVRRYPENSPMKDAYIRWGAINGRSSWDLLSVMIAVEGSADFKLIRGTNVVHPTGANTFIPGKGTHRYVVKDKSDRYYAARISDLLATYSNKRIGIRKSSDRSTTML